MDRTKQRAQDLRRHVIHAAGCHTGSTVCRETCRCSWIQDRPNPVQEYSEPLNGNMLISCSVAGGECRVIRGAVVTGTNKRGGRTAGRGHD